MIKRIVCMKMHPERVSEFEKLMQQHLPRIRNFPGCKHLELWKDVDDPSRIFTFSIWDNIHCLEEYRRSPLFEEVWGKTKKMFSEKPLAWSVRDYQEIHHETSF